MRFSLFLVLIIVAVGMCTGQESCPLGSVYYTISVPEGWNIAGVGCCGITASDSANPARGILALNHLHQGFNMLPSPTSPENYLVNYMPRDFSLGDKQITNMKFLFDETNQDLANAFASYLGFMSSGKSMRCSFEVNGIPAEGSFTVVTSDLMDYGTTIDFLTGIFAPVDQFDTDALMLIDVFKSIKLMPQYRNICTPPIGGTGCYSCIDEEWASMR